MTPKTRNHEFGKMTFKAYCRPAGHGWEVGMTCAGKPVFVGNFIHKTEATYWWKHMNSNMTTFCNTYEFMPTASKTWYCKFVSNYIYKSYYTWLDKAFNKYTKNFTRATATDFKKYRTFERTWNQRAA